ncbi:MAG TPA: hypothetical protein HPP83_09990 [Candidatus Hydrogenedentes bacterium]|nr:hypothetical protein [Candidatus Hydrogenedentota bacterium]
MMLKGSVYQRRNGPVRQFGVTVRGSTRVVTSGEVVDRETYLALIAANAIRPAPCGRFDNDRNGSEGAADANAALHPELETPFEE